MAGAGRGGVAPGSLRQVHGKDYVRLPSGCVKGYKGIPRFVSVFRFHYGDSPDQRIYQMRPPDHIPSCLEGLGTRLGMVW